MSGARLNTTCETTVSIPEDSDEHQEVIEVQILPQVIVVKFSNLFPFDSHYTAMMSAICLNIADEGLFEKMTRF